MMIIKITKPKTRKHKTIISIYSKFKMKNRNGNQYEITISPYISSPKLDLDTLHPLTHVEATLAAWNKSQPNWESYLAPNPPPPMEETLTA